MDTLGLLPLRWFGISGVFGSILFIAGDLLYNHVPGSSKSPTEKMSALPESRLLNAGTLGLIGCWFYTLASGQIYIAFKPVGTTFATNVFLAFAAVMICYGITHTAFFAIASGAQIAARLGSDVESGGRLGNVFYQRLVNITYIPVAIASLMMLYGILSGQSLYPRWMAIFLPVITYLLKTPILRLLRGHLREIVNDSYDNMILLIFYVVSAAVLWNVGIT
jgi:hypothetical protein